MTDRGKADCTVFYAINYQLYQRDKPVMLEKYMARTTDKGYMATAKVEGDQDRGWLPTFSKEDADRYGSTGHAYKDPLKALDLAEREVMVVLRLKEDELAILKDKLDQIERLRRKHRR